MRAFQDTNEDSEATKKAIQENIKDVIPKIAISGLIREGWDGDERTGLYVFSVGSSGLTCN